MKSANLERWISYAVTPTLSVAAVQLSATVVLPAVAVSAPGAVGGVTSVAAAVTTGDGVLVLPARSLAVTR